jgi:hypothetical protein
MMGHSCVFHEVRSEFVHISINVSLQTYVAKRVKVSKLQNFSLRMRTLEATTEAMMFECTWEDNINVDLKN